MDGEAGKGGVGSRHAARQASGETTQEAKKNHNAEQVTAKEAGEEKSEKAKGEKAKDQEGAELEARKAGEFAKKEAQEDQKAKSDAEVLFEGYPPPRAGQVSRVSDRKRYGPASQMKHQEREKTHCRLRPSIEEKSARYGKFWNVVGTQFHNRGCS